jgi:hypothetical protein
MTAFYLFTVSLYFVTVWYFSPGFNMVVGKAGLLGESGKCWVSRQSAACLLIGCPLLVLMVPSRKLPE